MNNHFRVVSAFTIGALLSSSEPTVLVTFLPFSKVGLNFLSPIYIKLVTKSCPFHHIVSPNSGLIFKKQNKQTNKTTSPAFFIVFPTPNILEHPIHSYYIG